MKMANALAQEGQDQDQGPKIEKDIDQDLVKGEDLVQGQEIEEDPGQGQEKVGDISQDPIQGKEKMMFKTQLLVIKIDMILFSQHDHQISLTQIYRTLSIMEINLCKVQGRLGLLHHNRWDH